MVQKKIKNSANTGLGTLDLQHVLGERATYVWSLNMPHPFTPCF